MTTCESPHGVWYFRPRTELVKGHERHVANSTGVAATISLDVHHSFIHPEVTETPAACYPFNARFGKITPHPRKRTPYRLTRTYNITAAGSYTCNITTAGSYTCNITAAGSYSYNITTAGSYTAGSYTWALLLGFASRPCVVSIEQSPARLQGRPPFRHTGGGVDCYAGMRPGMSTATYGMI